MALTRSRMLYLIAMLVAGVAIGFLVQERPELRQAVIAPLVWPFVVSLVLDFGIKQAAERGKAEPLTMGDRFLGVFGAGLVVTLMLALEN